MSGSTTRLKTQPCSALEISLITAEVIKTGENTASLASGDSQLPTTASNRQQGRREATWEARMGTLQAILGARGQILLCRCEDGSQGMGPSEPFQQAGHDVPQGQGFSGCCSSPLLLHSIPCP